MGIQDREADLAGNRQPPLPGVLLRRVLIGVGWLMVVLGAVGVILPVLPTTPFLILAAWAFSRSSRRFHDWLYGHPRLGPPLRAWSRYGVIPTRAKMLSLAGMWGSLALVVLFVSDGWLLPAAHAAIITVVTAYVLSRPSHPPEG